RRPRPGGGALVEDATEADVGGGSGRPPRSARAARRLVGGSLPRPGRLPDRAEPAGPARPPDHQGRALGVPRGPRRVPRGGPSVPGPHRPRLGPYAAALAL